MLDMDPLTIEGLNPEQLTLLHDIMAAGPIESWPASLAENPEVSSLTFAPHAQLLGGAPSSSYGRHGVPAPGSSMESGAGKVDRVQQQRSGDDRRALASPRWRKRNPLEGYVGGASGSRDSLRMALDPGLAEDGSMRSSASRVDRMSHPGRLAHVCLGWGRTARSL